LLHRSPAACSPGFPWAGQLFFFSNWTSVLTTHHGRARHAAEPDVRFVRYLCRWCVAHRGFFQPYLCLVA
jgi:hypothetical protein